MSISTSRLSYADCYELMDRAVADAKGVRIFIGSEDKATHFRMRCHTARQINRRDNEKIYPVGQPMHGASPYDALTFRIREDDEGQYWVYAEKSELDPGDIEPLSEMED